MKILIFLLCGLSLAAQTHPYSNAWSYYTSTVTSAAQFTATTVAGTGGTSTHTMSTIAIYVQSPGGRSNAAYDYPWGTTGQATTYLSLCGGGVCEDGQFFASTVGTNELCGQTSQTLPTPTQAGNNTVNAWVRWLTPTSGQLSPTFVARTNGAATYTGSLEKSTNCTGVADISCNLWPNPGTISVSCDPVTAKPATFVGNAGTVQWTIRSGAGNSNSGINVTSCSVIGSPGANAVTLTVN
jgi:hypothetical protein